MFPKPVHQAASDLSAHARVNAHVETRFGQCAYDPADMAIERGPKDT